MTPVNEELYDAEWVQNMVNYASGELADASSGDEWRSVIFLAYSNYDPHKAAKLSTLLTNWGSGNSYSNQVCEHGLCGSSSSSTCRCSSTSSQPAATRLASRFVPPRSATQKAYMLYRYVHAILRLSPLTDNFRTLNLVST